MCRLFGDDVLLDGADVPPGSEILFALGLNGVTLCGQALVNYGAREI